MRETICLNCIIQDCRPDDTWCLLAIWKRHDDRVKQDKVNAAKRDTRRQKRIREVNCGNLVKARAVRSKVASYGLRKYDKRTNRTGCLNLVKAKGIVG